MTRIHIPVQVVDSILFLIENRRTNIITEYGLTDSCYLKRGIDQGDAISPLLWCIFYDTLLSKVSDKCPGAEISTIQYHNILKQHRGQKVKTNLLAMAYMDDTIWLTNIKV